MRYLLYPVVKVALSCWFALMPLAWFADCLFFAGPRAAVGPWMLLVLMLGPIPFTAALNLAILNLPVLNAASLRSNLVASCGLLLCLSAGAKADDKPSGVRPRSLTEFDGKDAMNWQVVNDGVMGGLSEGKLTQKTAGTMMFSGMLSLENNGGFSTFRSGTLKLDLSRHSGLVLRVRGDGRTYQVRFATDARFRGMEVSFAAEFATIKGEWTEVKVPFAHFEGSFRGLDLPEERLDTSKIQRVSILISDKRQAPFAVELDFIRTYGTSEPKA